MINIKCLICGVTKKFLGQHLKNKHNLTQKEYYDSYLRQPNEGYCLHCGRELKFIKLSKGYGLFCSTHCQTSSQYRKDKIKATCLERYGVENVYQTEYVKQCSRNSKKQAIETLKKHNLEKYGVENNWQRPDIVKRMQYQKQIDYKQFEKDHNTTSMKALVNLYGEGWKQSKILNIPRLYFRSAAFIDNSYIPVIKEYYENHNKGCASEYEFELVKTINSVYYGDILKRKRTIIAPQELDIYIPDLKIAIEFNGNYWHRANETNKNYHLNKSLACREKGIRLIHIYQFEDFDKQKQLLKDLILGIDNYPKNDFNKNNFGPIPESPEIICNSPYIIYGAGKLL